MVTLFSLILIAAVFHYSYLHSLSPILRDIYSNKGDYPKTGTWSADPNEDVKNYIHLGMSRDEVLAFIDASGLNVSPNQYRSPKEISKYDTRIIAYKKLRSGFAGLHIMFGISNTFRIEFNFNNNILENYNSALVTNTL